MARPIMLPTRADLVHAREIGTAITDLLAAETDDSLDEAEYALFDAICALGMNDDKALDLAHGIRFAVESL